MRRNGAIITVLLVSILGGWKGLSRLPKATVAAQVGAVPDGPAKTTRHEATSVSPSRWTVTPPGALVANPGLCGTEVPPVDPDSTEIRVHPTLRALTSRVPTSPEIRQAFEDFALSGEDDATDIPGLTESALEERNQVERDLADHDLPEGTGPEAAEAWGERADKLRGLGRREDALKAAEESFRLTSDSLEAVERLAFALDEMDRPAQAKAVLERALSATTDQDERAWLLEHLGYLCSERHNEACAEQAEQALSGLQPAGKLDEFLHAVRLAEAGSFEEAREAFADRAESDTDFATAGNLALATTAAGQLDQAKEAWNNAMQLASSTGERVTVLSGLGGAYLEEGDTVSAWLAGAAALAVAGDRATASDAHRLLALTALAVGDLDEARAQVQKSRQANPYDDLVRTTWFAHPAEAASMQALWAETQGDVEGAKAAWLKVARSHHPRLGFAARQALGGLCRA